MDDETADFEAFYEPGELARIDGTRHPAPAPTGAVEDAPVIPRYPVARRRLGSAVLAASMLGVADVIEPDRARQHVIDFVPDKPDENTQPVTFHHVPGDPRASRIVLRPWLFHKLGRRR
jgi:hypothetical protein